MLFGKLFTNPKMWVNGDADEITMGGVYTCKDVQNVPTGDGALFVFKTENTVKQVFIPVGEEGVVYTRVLGEEWASVTGTSEETEALIQSAIVKANQAQAKANTVDTRLNNIIVESGTSDAEVVAARTDSSGQTFTTLGQRLDTQFGEIKEDLSHISSIPYTFKNDMYSDGVGNLPNCTIYKTNVASNSNYGQSGSRYVFAIPNALAHVYFEFRMDKAISSLPSTATSRKFLTLFGNIARIGFGGAIFENGELYQKITLSLQSGSNTKNLTLNTIRYDRVQGKDAVLLRYSGNLTSNNIGSVTFRSDTIDINIDGTATSVPVSSSTSIADVVSAINAVSGIEAEALIENELTYADLLPSVSATTTINLLVTGTLYDGTSYTDNPPIYIPLALDKRWHSIEMVADPDGKTYMAFDGITLAVNSVSSSFTDNIIINEGNSLITIRNLEVDYGTMGEAELVENLVNPATTPDPQLVSPHNPRVVIYEGHGVDVCTEADAPVSDNMACSTERLRILFATAKAKGYKAITWDDFVKWKLNGNSLPKRSLLIMFDDWRFENYINYNKRKPFVDYDVRCGLAVITNDKTLSETVTINGMDYSASDCVNIVKTAGWYPCSHTHAHRQITSSTPSENIQLFKTDVLEADKYGIHSNVLVYPHGDYSQAYKGVISHSGFALGVNIARNAYNCKGSNNYYIVRVELGTRVPISTALYPLV